MGCNRQEMPVNDTLSPTSATIRNRFRGGKRIGVLSRNHSCLYFAPPCYRQGNAQMVYRAFPSEPFEEIGNVIQYSRSSAMGGIYYR